jgi:hypothetical protein
VTQDRKIFRRAQNAGEHPAILQEHEPQRPSQASRDRRPAGAFVGLGFSEQPGGFLAKHGMAPIWNGLAPKNRKSRRGRTPCGIPPRRPTR